MVELKKYYLLALVFIPLNLIFHFLEVYIVPKYTMYNVIDSYIPFVPVFVIFYIIWFFYMIVTALFFMFKSREDFLKITAFLSIGMILSLIVFIIFPNQQNLRPICDGTDVFSRTIAFLYSVDTSTNVCPSMHVINSIGVHVTVAKSDIFKNNALVKNLSLFTMVMIVLSTMFIKQHSVIDVFWGCIFSLLTYLVVYKVLFVESAPLKVSDRAS